MQDKSSQDYVDVIMTSLRLLQQEKSLSTFVVHVIAMYVQVSLDKLCVRPLPQASALFRLKIRNKFLQRSLRSFVSDNL